MSRADQGGLARRARVILAKTIDGDRCAFIAHSGW